MTTLNLSRHKTIVLMVEDSPQVRYLWERALKNLDVEIWECASLEEAKVLSHKIPPPDIMLLDIRLNDTHELETLNTIGFFRKGNPDLIVVVLSGYLDKKAIELAVSQSVQGIWDKSVVTRQSDLWNILQHAMHKAPIGAKERMEYTSNLLDRLVELKNTQVQEPSN